MDETRDELYLIDAFTRPPDLAGNVAAVAFPAAPRSDAWMARVAQETNAPATAFLSPAGGGAYLLRWFSPATELVLCGHGTLAAAHALYESGRLAPEEEARLETRSAGTLRARRDGDGIALDFPAKPSAPVATPPGLAAALGVKPIAVSRGQLDYLLELGSEEQVRGLTPDTAALAAIPDARGFIVTARAAGGSDFDFVSRFFSPSTGIAEDPVTGSAHCALGPYWAARLNKSDLLGWQASGRGGVVRVRVGGPDAARVTLVGRAITVLRGALIPDALPN